MNRLKNPPAEAREVKKLIRVEISIV
jgi:hypothetical protein